MQRTAIVWDPAFSDFDGGYGPPGFEGMPPTRSFDQPDTVDRAYEMAKNSENPDRYLWLEPDSAGAEELACQHSVDYIERVRALSEGDGGDAGFLAYTPPGGFETLAKATGSALAGIRATLSGTVRNAFAFARPGGHHAMPDMGMGNAVFAHLATALTIVRSEFEIPRVAILDWDVHHGNGTEARFLSDPETLFISVHQDRCFPKNTGGIEVRGEGEGLGANINIPLPPGAGHGAYLDTISEVVVPAFERFQPDLILISNGVDGNGTDPLGRMMCHSGTYRAMTDAIVEAADRLCDGRLVVCHEGGYSAQVAPWCILAVIEGLAACDPRPLDQMSLWIAANAGHETKDHEQQVIAAAAELAGQVPTPS